MRDTIVIAEAGVNHNGSLEMAKNLVDIAAISGADIVKFQTFKAEHLVTMNADKAEYQKVNTEIVTLNFHVKNLEIDDLMHMSLIEYCYKKNIIFLSTPFYEMAGDYLEDKVPF